MPIQVDNSLQIVYIGNIIVPFIQIPIQIPPMVFKEDFEEFEYNEYEENLVFESYRALCKDEMEFVEI